MMRTLVRAVYGSIIGVAISAGGFMLQDAWRDGYPGMGVLFALLMACIALSALLRLWIRLAEIDEREGR